VYLWRTPSCQLVENIVRLIDLGKTGYVGAHGRLDWLIEGTLPPTGTPNNFRARYSGSGL
jgi:hypothetical protein